MKISEILNEKSLIELFNESVIESVSIAPQDKIDLDKSFASLVKYNNGLFKSEKQAKFLLSKCSEPNVYFTYPGEMYGNQYYFTYECDNTGVIKVEKHTGSKKNQGRGKTETVWERPTEGTKPAQQLKADTQNAKHAKKLYKNIENLEADIDYYKEKDDPTTYGFIVNKYEQIIDIKKWLNDNIGAALSMQADKKQLAMYELKNTEYHFNSEVKPTYDKLLLDIERYKNLAKEKPEIADDLHDALHDMLYPKLNNLKPTYDEYVSKISNLQKTIKAL
jgi:hypothetical protein